MADGKITIDAEVNSSGVDKDLNKLNSKIKDVTKSTKAMSTIAKSSGWAAVIGAELKAFKSYWNAIRQSTEVYKVQEKAEKSLAKAAENNPYLNNQNVQSLKNFASEMQKIGNVGDETLIPLMSTLAAAGRTQEEIEQIIKASLDLSANGTVDLNTAVIQLNATYTGTTGTLGKLVPSIKDLTAEELKEGAAVQKVAEAYKGMYKEMADPSKQRANAKGDLTEQFGRWNKEGNEAWDKLWTGFYTKAAAAFTKVNDAIDKMKVNWAWGDYFDDMEKAYNRASDKQAFFIQNAKKMNAEQVESAISYLANDKDILSNTYMQEQLRFYEKILPRKKEAAQADKENIELLRKETAERNAANQRDADAQALIDNNTDALNKNIAAIKARYDLQEAEGNDIDDEARDQEILNAMEESYLELIATDTSLVTENNSAAKKRLEEIIALQKRLGQTAQTPTTDLEPKIDLSAVQSEIENLSKDSMSLVESEVNMILSSTEYTEEEKFAIEEEWEQKRKEMREQSVQNQLDTLSTYTEKYAEITEKLSDTMQETVENESSAELATLEKQYGEGKITEEEYYKQKEKIEKQAAEKSYKLQMWTWTSQLAQIAVSTAQGVMSAISTAGNIYAGIAMAATVGTMGAAELAAAIASKPVPPSYAQGGIVGGGSYSGGDNRKTYTNIKTGEMILNDKQQLALWRMANGSGGSGNNLNVAITNYKGNDTSVQTSLDGNTLRVVVDSIVNDSLKNGSYNTALMTAQNSFNGTRYSN